MSNLGEQSESNLLKELEKLRRKFENDLVHRTFIYEELVEYFHEYMPHLLKYNPLNLYTNPLSNFIRIYMGKYVPGCIDEEFKKYEDSLEFKLDMQEVKDFYKSLVEDDAILSQKEFDELSKLSIIDDENSCIFIKYLLGQLIEGNNSAQSSVSNILINYYFSNLLRENDLFYQRPTNINTDIDTEFKSRIINTLYPLFYGAWSKVQRNAEYNDPSIISMIKIDDYFRDVYGAEYYEENKESYSSEVDANLNATLLLADFLQEVSPVTFHEHRDWLNERAKRLTDTLYNRQRTFKDSKYDIDEIFEQTLAYTGENKEDIIGTSNSKKAYQKEIKI